MMPDVFLGAPNRDQQTENMITTVRNIVRCGTRYLATVGTLRRCGVRSLEISVVVRWQSLTITVSSQTTPGLRL
jgi:hypothetical protein